MRAIKNTQPNRKLIVLITLSLLAALCRADDQLTEAEHNWIVGRINDEPGKPLADVFVEIIPQRFNTGESKVWNQSTVSNEFGRFVFPNAIPDLEYTLHARKGGYDELYRQVDFRNRSNVSVELGARTTRTLTGRITDSRNGTTPLNAAVTLLDSYEHSYQRTVNADNKGRFVFDDVPTAMNQATIWAKKEYDASDYVVIHSKTSNVDLSLDTAGTVSGQIRSDLGDPISGCEVILRHSPMSAYRGITKTDDSGKFRFAALPLGEYIVSAVHPEWFEPYRDFSNRGEVRVEAGNDKPFQIVLHEKAVITGKVVGVNNQPIEAATVCAPTAAIDRENRYHIVQTDKDGSFTVRTGFIGRTHGSLQLVALHPKFGTGKIRLEEPSAASVPTIKLDGTMRIRGQVADAHQRPIENVFVGLPGGGLTTDAEGRFESSVIPIPNDSGSTSIGVSSSRPDNGGVSFFSWSSRTRPAKLPEPSSRFFLDKTISVSTTHDSQLELNIFLEQAKVVRIMGSVVNKENKPISGGLAIVILGNAPDDWLELLHPNLRGGGTFRSRDYAPVGRTVIDENGQFAIATMRETVESIAVIAPHVKNVDTAVFAIGVETPTGGTTLVKGIKFDKSTEMKLRIEVP